MRTIIRILGVFYLITVSLESVIALPDDREPKRYAPVITRPPKNATVLLQRRYALPCESSGNPRPKVSWFFNGNALNSRGSNYRISSQSGSLRFSRVNVNNGGFYQCQARNKLGKVTSGMITFTVHAPATFVETPKDRFVNYGSKIQMRCVVAGIPTPTIHWSKNGALIENPQNMSQNYQNSVFYINMMTSPKVVKSLLHINATENAHYRCHAANLHVGGPSKIVKEASVNILPPYQGK